MQLLRIAFSLAYIATAYGKWVCSNTYGNNGYTGPGTSSVGNPQSGALSQNYDYTLSGSVCPDNFYVYTIAGSQVYNYPYDYRYVSIGYSPFIKGPNAPIDRLFIRCAGLTDPMNRNSFQIAGYSNVGTMNSVSGQYIDFQSPMEGYANAPTGGAYTSVVVNADSFVRFISFEGVNVGTLQFPPPEFLSGKYFQVRPTSDSSCRVAGMFSYDTKKQIYGPIGSVGFIFDCDDAAKVDENFNAYDGDCDELVKTLQRNATITFKKGTDKPVDE